MNSALKKLMESVETADKRDIVNLYALAMGEYQRPGSPRLSDDAAHWRTINNEIEAQRGALTLERIKMKAGVAARAEARKKSKPSRLPAWASKRQLTSYTVAIDDSGQTAVRASDERRCFFIGGVILPTRRLEHLRHSWTVAHAKQGEVKARTFVADLGFDRRSNWAEAFLSMEMDLWKALPIWISFDKTAIGLDATLPTRRGGRRIKLDQAMPLFAASLSTHLTKVNGHVEVLCIDRMASEHEEIKLQQAWENGLRVLSPASRQRLPATLDFTDSQHSPEIQVADVLMGLMRSAHENERGMAPGLARLIRRAQEQGLFGFHTG